MSREEIIARHPFIGRKRELERLKALRERQMPGLVVIKGRRWIGKSRLIAEFARSYPEQGLTAQAQRNHLSGASASLAMSSYFYRIVDIADFLEGKPGGEGGI